MQKFKLAVFQASGGRDYSKLLLLFVARKLVLVENCECISQEQQAKLEEIRADGQAHFSKKNLHKLSPCQKKVFVGHP